ncbi:MAG: urease accessory protein UreD, partial [Ideonella sp.]|nr:urease accessory protein UreD [Ideonella sp.]
MAWHGRLALDYDRDDRGGTRARSRHHGPMRVLASLYPEGPAVCHHVLVHPPGGLVGGDVLELELALAGGSHAVITTPGA